MGRMAIKRLRAFHQCLGQGRMWMDTPRNVLRRRAHFNRQYRFGNQFARARAANANAQHTAPFPDQ